MNQWLARRLVDRKPQVVKTIDTLGPWKREGALELRPTFARELLHPDVITGLACCGLDR
jgi:hypothetical protein